MRTDGLLVRLALGGFMLAGLAAAVGAGEPAKSGASDGPVLDWGSYWRFHLTFRSPRYSPGSKDWHGKPVDYVAYERGAQTDGTTIVRVSTPDAPADWMKPEFDDSSWARGTRPEFGCTFWNNVVRVERLRGRFEVADPARVTGLRVDIEYLGGVAVYLNGQELARGHLPAGPLSAEVLAEPYPQEAYEWGLPQDKKHGYFMGFTEWAPPADPKAARWRKLAVNLDPKLLRKGANVLAVALHQSSYNWYQMNLSGYVDTGKWITGPAAQNALQAANGRGIEDPAKGVRVQLGPWPHLMIKELKLTASPPGAVPRPGRASGIRAWAADIHQRTGELDPGEPGEGAADAAPPVVRIVAARNGSHSAQVVAGTSEALKGLSAAMSDLVQAGGAGKIPAGAVRVRYGQGVVPDLKQLESRAFTYSPLMCLGESKQVMDRLADRPPESVPANTCQPVWITVKVPKDAAPGEYRGTLSFQPAGLKPVEVRLQVMDWTLPDPKDYASFVGLEHAFWGAPAEYKVQPWSEEHWKHLDRVVKLLGEVGNKEVSLPLTCEGTEGNWETLVPWVRKGEGYDYDWAILDRYLGLVARHWSTNVSVVGQICSSPFGQAGRGKLKVVAQEMAGSGLLATAVTVRGEKEPLILPAPGSEEWKKLFVPFAKALRQHLKEKGFEKLYWGWFHDWASGAQVLAAPLAEELPDVGWARSSHYGSQRRAFSKDCKAEVTLDMRIRAWTEPFNSKTHEPVSHRGWARPGNVLFPRYASSIQHIGYFEWPMALHWLTENCLVNGAAGVGRLGADFWPSRPIPYNYFSPAMTDPYLLPPGPDGADASQRFEALREGVQEAEARIWLEKNGKDAQEPAKTVLADRIRVIATLDVSHTSPINSYFVGWQERSWDLYAAAAAASGGKAPGAQEKAAFFAAGAGK